MNKVFLILASIILSQISYSQPKTIVTFNGGYTLPIGDTRGSFGDSLIRFTGNGNPDSSTYFMKNGYNFGILVQHRPFKKNELRFILGFQFIYMLQNKDYNENNNQVNSSLNLRMIQLSFGPGYMFGGKDTRIRPFLETALTVNFFGGSYTETPARGDVGFYTLNPTVRLGILAGGGLNIKLGRRIGIETGAKFNLANLIGKSSNGDQGKTYSLNDKEATVNGVHYVTRNVTFIQIYAGLSLYLGL